MHGTVLNIVCGSLLGSLVLGVIIAWAVWARNEANGGH